MFVRLEQAYMGINRVISRILAILLILMVINVFYDDIMRYFFHNS